MRRSIRMAGAVATAVALLSGGTAWASTVDTAVVDVTAPINSVTLAPGETSAITINMTITGNQAGTSTFQVDRDYTLSGDTFTGSNPETFTVAPRTSGAAATTFTTKGQITVAAGQAAREQAYSLTVAASDFEHSNKDGAKLGAGKAISYAVTVSAPSDRTAPTWSCAPAVASAEWQNSNGSHQCQASDPSGLQTGSPASFTLATTVPDGSETGDASTGTQELCDTLGNCTTAGPISGWKVDRKAPAVTGGTTTAAPSAEGWYSADVTVDFAAADAGSGLADDAAATFSKATTGEGADVTVESGPVADRVGNSHPGIASSSFKVDKTNPVAGFTADSPADGGSYFAANAPAATCAGTDTGGSGLATQDGCTLTTVDGGDGVRTVTATATDKAGNTHSVSRSFTVRDLTHAGFYKPVDMVSAVNIVKGGSTVPLKFNLQLDGVQSSDTSLAKFSATKVACLSGANLEEQPVEELSSGNTTLRWDATGQQFIQNWKTPTGTNVCYRATVTLADGDAISALFKLK